MHVIVSVWPHPTWLVKSPPFGIHNTGTHWVGIHNTGTVWVGIHNTGTLWVGIHNTGNTLGWY